MSHSFASLNALLHTDVDKELLECISLETSTSNPEDNPFKTVYEARERLRTLRHAVYRCCGFAKTAAPAAPAPLAQTPQLSKPSLMSVADAPLLSFSGQPAWGQRSLRLMDAAISQLHSQVLKAFAGSLLPIASASEAASWSRDLQLQLQHLDAVLDSRLGSNFVQAEELGEGERMLSRAAQLLRGCGPAFLLERVRVLNSVGIVWSGRGEHEKARVHLEEAHSIFSSALEQGCADEGDLAQAHTMSCFYLAQVFGHLGQVALSAAMCQITLRRQCLLPDLDRREWALNAVQLSGYFLTQDDWVNAHRCLAAAEVVLEEGMRQLGSSQSPGGDADDEYSVRGRMKQASANIGWGWGKLYKSKLEAGRSGSAGRAVTPVEFPGILSPTPDAQARALEAVHISYDSACDLIKKGLAGFSRAHAHYKLDGFVTDHCTIAHDISGMYRALCRYTDDDSTKCKLHKRRMDLIMPLARVLNPTAFCDMYRVLCFETAEAAKDSVEVKTSQDAGKAPAAARVNELCRLGIEMYKKMLASFVMHDAKDIGRQDEDDTKMVLTAKFGCARLYSRIVAPDVDSRRLNLQACYAEYQWIIAYSEKFNVQVFQEEVALCREMASLIPAQIAALSSHGAVHAASCG